MNTKLLIADVDGTLLTRSKTLTPSGRSRRSARLRAAGIAFTITSGRPPRGMAMFVEPLGLTMPIAAINRGVFVNPDLKTVLVQRAIAPDVAAEAVELLLAAGLDVWVYQGDDWFVRNRDAYRVEHESETVRFAPTVVDDLTSVLDESIKIVGVSEDLDLVARCERELGARLGADATAARSQPYYVDVTHPEANKGMVVREAARLLRIPVEQVATIGDMPNDLPMLNVAGLSIAMGNASDEVQRIARHVTTSNEAEGFAIAVDAYILGEPPLAHTALGLPPRARACICSGWRACSRRPSSCTRPPGRSSSTTTCASARTGWGSRSSPSTSCATTASTSTAARPPTRSGRSSSRAGSSSGTRRSARSPNARSRS